MSKSLNQKKQVLKRIAYKRFKRSLHYKYSLKQIRKNRLKKFLVERNLVRQHIPIVEAPEILALAPAGLTKMEANQATEHTRFV